jgi:hypothetical protein
MSEEEGHLVIRKTEHFWGQELLSAALAKETKVV